MYRKALIILLLAMILPSSPSPLQGQIVDRTLRIGVASMITPVDAVRYYQDIVDYISEKLGVPVEMVHRRTYDEMDRMLERGDVDAAFICSAPYVKNRREFGVELLVAPRVNGGVFYRSYIIVHKDSPVRTFDDLRGKSFAFTDPKSNTGRLYPEYILAKQGLRPEEFFSRFLYSYSHNKSVELVAKKVVDAAAVESLVYEYMKSRGSEYVGQTRIIKRSPEFGIPPVVVPAGLPVFIKEKLREILTGMHLDPKGKRILDAMLIERFVVASDRNYDTIREMEAFIARNRSPRKPEEKGSDAIHFGVVPRDNPRMAYEKYQPLIDYLSETTPYRFELVLKKTYEDTVYALGTGEIEMALLGPLAYLEARALFGAVSILKGTTVKGEPFYRSVIITKRDSPVNDLSDLRGKAFAFAALKSTSGNLIPRYLLAGAGIHLSELGEYRNFAYHDSVVKWVLRGKYDAGAVREVIAEKYLPLGLKIIASSEPIPTGPVVVGPRTPYAVAETVKRVLQDMGRTERGREVLGRLDPEVRGGFVAADDSDYEGIREMINEVPRTCGAGCHPKIRL